MADLGRQLADLLYGESQQPKETTGQKIARRLTGAGETAATIGTGLLGSVPAGLAGLSQLIPTRGRAPDVNRAAQKVEDVQSALTYLPRTETGQRYLQNTAGALETLGAPAEYLGEKALQYTGSPGVATAANVLLDPVNFIGLPGSGKATVAATKAAGRAAMAAPRVAAEMAGDILAPKSRFESQRGAIKMKGGNWLAGEVETAVDPLKPRGPKESDREWILQHAQNQRELGQDPSRILAGLEAIPKNEALDRWIDKKLGGYIKNEMGTPEDPVRKLADQGIIHFQNLREFDVEYMSPSLKRHRRLAGFPEEGYASTDLGRAWEAATDKNLMFSQAGDYQGSDAPGILSRNPWLEKVPGETPVYETAARFDTRDLGFDHLIDVLKEDLATGRIRPEQLEKMSMEQAVRRAHQYDQEMAEKAAKATAAAREGLPVYKEYPQGYRWIELNKPGAFAAESDTMGHSVRGYEPPKGHPDWTEGSGDAGSLSYGLGGWEAIKHGDAKVYSLVDSKGSPHVTVEIGRGKHPIGYSFKGASDEFPKTFDYNLTSDPEFPMPTREQKQAILTRAAELHKSNETMDRMQAFQNAANEIIGELPSRINQIKGKSNRAPKEDYLPFVQDFVRSGRWSDIRDIQNAGMRPTSSVFSEGELKMLRDLGETNIPPALSGVDIQRLHNLINPEGKRLIYDARGNIVGDETRRGYADGGAVMPAAEIGGGEFVRVAEKYGLGSDNATLNRIVQLVNKGMSLDQAAKKLASKSRVRISDNPDTMRLELATGGAVKMVAGGLTAAKGAAKTAAKGAAKAVKEEKLSVPYDIPRAPAKTKEEIRPIAQRMAEQMTGEFVRPDPKVSKNPAGKTYQQFLMEKELEGRHQYRKTKDVPEPEAADIEKQQGMVKFGISGDTTMADTELLRAGPYQMEDAVPLHGGPRFPLGGEGAWASNNPIAANVQKRIGEMSHFFDAPVLGQYMTMGPAGSMFAQHLADANLQAIDLSKMTKSQIEQFNKLIREGNKKSGPRPTFPGIQDKNEAYLWMAFDPKLRIHFNELMQKPTVTGALNLPDGRIILDAVTEPELRNKEIMTSGLSQFQFDPSIRPEDIPLSMHPTYTHLIPMKQGAPVTRTRYPTPAELEFSDVANFIRQNYPAKEFTRTMQTSSPRQLIDQQAIDEIKMFEEFMKQYTGKKKGGAVKKQAGGAIKAAAKAVKPSAEQAAKMASQQAEMALKNRAMQELKAQFEDLPLGQQPQGWMSPERLQQKIEEIRRREATPVGGQIPLMQAGGAVKAAARAASKAARLSADEAKAMEAEARALAAQVRERSKAFRASGADQLSDEVLAQNRADSMRVSELMARVEEARKPEVKIIERKEPSWYADMTPTQKKALQGLQDWQGGGFSLRPSSESLIQSAQSHFNDFEVAPGVRSVPLSAVGPLTGYNSPKDVRRIADLRAQIEQSKEIEPIFVGIDPSGQAYVMEGQHRSRAFQSMGLPNIPARVVVDFSAPVKKAIGGAVKKVKFTDNLDAMRLAVQKRK
jgi:hypothetical protein